MKLCALSFVVALLIVPLPAAAQYDNGPVNGQVDAWTLNFGYSVSDSLPNAEGTFTGIAFWAWLVPGDTITNIEVLIGSAPFGGDLFDEFVNLTQSDCFTNNYGYNVCEEMGSFAGPSLSGNYWLTLQNANVPSGDPVYWDENSGVGCTSPGCPSQAQENGMGSIPSEAFTLEGCGVDSPLCTTTTNDTPEPSSLMLLASGALGVVGWLRRKRLF